MKLSILIPTTPDRDGFMDALFLQFEDQMKWVGGKQIPDWNGCVLSTAYFTYSGGLPYSCEIEVIDLLDEKTHSIGWKRNRLLEQSVGEYIAFIDSDDRIGERYFKHAIEGILQKVDVCGLTGIITEDGKNPKKFVHSLKYDSWFEKDNIYYRNNNHLNVIKRSIAIQMKFPEINMGEDHDYSKQLQRSGLIKTEYWDENEILYYYDYRSKK